MRRTLKFLAVASAVMLPAAAHAQACSAADLAANPLVGLGYRALARINNTAFDLSCYYQDIGGNQVALQVPTSIQYGSGPSAVTGTINQAVFTTSPANPVKFTYSLSSTIPVSGPTAADFVYAFAAPLSSNLYTDATAQMTVVRGSGGPSVRLVPPSSSATPPLPGFPTYLAANNTVMTNSQGGTVANPYQTGLVWVGTTPCVAANGTTCNYGPNATTPNANISAWGNTVSYRHDKRNTAAAVSGELTLTAAPEPATVTLMASGLLALVGAGFARRRNNA